MTPLTSVVVETTIASTSGMIISSAVNVDPLLTALITLGTSLVTIVGAELVKFLVAYLKNKTTKLEKVKKIKKGKK